MPVGGGSAQSFEERQLWSLESAGYRCITWIRGALTWTESRPWGQVMWLHHDQPDWLTSSVITHTLSSAVVTRTAACLHVVCSPKRKCNYDVIYILLLRSLITFSTFLDSFFIFFYINQWKSIDFSMKESSSSVNVLCVLYVDLDGRQLRTIDLTWVKKEYILFCKVVKISFCWP